MKYQKVAGLVVLSGLFLTAALAQAQVDLDILEGKVVQHVKAIKPGWQHKRIEPITGSTNVLVANWSFPKRGVRVSIIPHKSAAEARAALRAFVKYDREKEELNDIGDEGYAWGFERSNVAFTKGKFNVFVSAGADVDHDPDARRLSNSEKRAREYSEIKRLTREFAKHTADAVALP